jgi:hypothetical protein
MRRRLVLGAAIALGVGGCGSQVTKTVTVVRTVTRSATVTPALPSSTAALAAADLNLAYHNFQKGINRVPAASTQQTFAQTAEGFAAFARLRTKFDAALSNINFPDSDHNDVKTLLIADTAVEDALTALVDDGRTNDTSALSADERALAAAENRFDQALTAVQYDVGDTA